MEKSGKFIIFVVAFFVGIFGGDLFFDKRYMEMVLAIFLGLLFLVFYFGGRWRMILLLFLGVCVGFFRFMISTNFGEFDLRLFEGDAMMYGCVEEEVDVRVDKVKYVFEVRKILWEDQKFSTWGRVLVNAPRYPQYEYGDCFVLKGDLQEPEEFEGFAYDKYLARYQIFRVMHRPVLKKMQDVDVSLFFEKIFNLKVLFEQRLSKIFAEPQASFMAGLILGSRKGIPEELMADFNTTGLTHIIAISGYNITLLIVIVTNFLGFMGRRMRAFISILVIFVFVILVGASAAVVRAGIMGIISLLAVWYGRLYAVGIALFAAAFVMNMWNPWILINDVGFQLSFLATCGLIYVAPFLEKYFCFLPKFLGIRESVLMTISAQVLALPVILINFERFSLISPIANLFVLPFIPLAMLCGFFAVVFSYVWGFFGLVVGFLGYMVLEIVVYLVKIFAGIPLASFEVGWFNEGIFCFYYFWILRKLKNLNDK